MPQSRHEVARLDWPDGLICKGFLPSESGEVWQANCIDEVWMRGLSVPPQMEIRLEHSEKIGKLTASAPGESARKEFTSTQWNT